jgi:hypothetical protein
MANYKGPRISQDARFWQKVKSVSEGCWEWQAAKNNKGYGMFGEAGNKRLSLAHRVMWKMEYGEIPKGEWVLHHCDNPGCVNPEHLYLGNNTANVQDMHRKGRGWGGIGPETAYAILWRWASGENRQKIAEEYGVSLHVVKDIAARRTWKSLSELHD